VLRAVTILRMQAASQAAGGFDDDALEAISGEAPNEGGDLRLVVGDGEQELSFEEVDIEFVLADIDADIDVGTRLGHGYSVLLNSGS